MQFGEDFEKIFFRLSLVKTKYLKSIKSGFYTSQEIDILSQLSNKFFERFNETPTKDQLTMLIQRSEKAKEKITDGILNLVFDVDLDQFDEEWLTSTAESWIKYRHI